MVSYVLNVRADQIDDANDILRLPRFSLPAALKASGYEILLFASQGENNPGYYGTAIMGEPMPDLADPKKFRLPIYNMRNLDREISLAELRALGVEEMPFHTYSRPIRSIFEDERGCASLPWVQYLSDLVKRLFSHLSMDRNIAIGSSKKTVDSYASRCMTPTHFSALLPVRLSPAWMELDTASTLAMYGRVLQAAQVQFRKLYL